VGTGISIFLIAIGAILTFALNADVEGIDLDTVGVILMVVGAIGLLVNLYLLDRWRASRGRVVEQVDVRRDVI
jgi:hypothetical protein